jgi:subtilisin family serine protease
MAGVISDDLRNIIEEQEPDLVSSVIQAQPDKAADITRKLDEQGFEYRSSTVGQIAVIETNIAPGSLEDLAATDGIERVDHNPTFSIQGTVTDELGDVSGLAEAQRANRIGLQDAIRQMNIQAAWDSLGHRGEGVRLGMVDTGIEESHPAIRSSIAATAQNSTAEDHGSWVAGAMVSDEIETNRGETVQGAAPDAKLYAHGALSGGRANVVDIADGVSYLLERNVDVINLSLGGPHSDVLWDIVREVQNEGAAVVSSAGNAGPVRGSVSCPAHHDEPIAVASVATNGEVASFSARGPGFRDARDKPDVAAYGGGSRHVNGSPVVTESVLGPAEGGNYKYLIGTSMASPLVAAVTGLRASRGVL